MPIMLKLAITTTHSHPAIRFGAKLLETIPLPVYERGQYQKTIPGDVYEADSPADYDWVEPVLREWGEQREHTVTGDLWMSFLGLQGGLKCRQKKLYILATGPEKKILGCMETHKEDGNGRWLAFIEKAPGISDPQGTRIGNILKGMMYTDFKHYPLTDKEERYFWFPIKSSKPAYTRLFQETLGHPPNSPVEKNRSWWISKEDVQAFMTQVQDSFKRLMP